MGGGERELRLQMRVGVLEVGVRRLVMLMLGVWMGVIVMRLGLRGEEQRGLIVMAAAAAAVGQRCDDGGRERRGRALRGREEGRRGVGPRRA